MATKKHQIGFESLSGNLAIQCLFYQGDKRVLRSKYVQGSKANTKKYQFAKPTKVLTTKFKLVGTGASWPPTVGCCHSTLL